MISFFFFFLKLCVEKSWDIFPFVSLDASQIGRQLTVWPAACHMQSFQSHTSPNSPSSSGKTGFIILRIQKPDGPRTLRKAEDGLDSLWRLLSKVKNATSSLINLPEQTLFFRHMNNGIINTPPDEHFPPLALQFSSNCKSCLVWFIS